MGSYIPWLIIIILYLSLTQYYISLSLHPGGPPLSQNLVSLSFHIVISPNPLILYPFSLFGVSCGRVFFCLKYHPAPPSVS